MDPGISSSILGVGPRQDRADSSVVSGTRVAIVCGHFAPEVGYQEVDLARAFTRLGARVRVVTSTRLSPNARKLVQGEYQAGLARTEGYEVVRLAPRLTVGPNVLGCDTRPSIAEFSPDQVILIGPAKLFGLELFSSEPSPWRRIALFQDHSRVDRSTAGPPLPRSLRRLAHRLVKRPAYRRVVRNADRIILNVPETREVIEPWLGSRERELLALNAIELRLGFDPDRFFFDLSSREVWRASHGISDDELVLATCTRATPNKRIEDVISAVSALRAQGLVVRYALAGVLDDAYGETLRRHVGAQPDPKAFFLLPALPHSEMRELFCASDLGLWWRAAITIQQAMGTGLPVVVTRRPSVSHLLAADGRNGWYAEPAESFEQAVGAAVKSLNTLNATERLDRRMAIAEHNRTYLSYDVIALEMVREL